MSLPASSPAHAPAGVAASLCRNAQGGQTPGRPQGGTNVSVLSFAVGGQWHQGLS